MYSVLIKQVSVDKVERQIVLDVEYLKDGVVVANKTERFNLTTTLNRIKRHVKSVIESLQNSDVELPKIPLGELDLSDVVDAPPTQAEIDRDAWLRNLEILTTLHKKLITTGVFPATQADFVELKNKVAADFRKAYINDIL